MLKIILNTFCKNSRNTVNNEPILNQERFEPAEWTRPINEQIRLLQEVYYRGGKLEFGYRWGRRAYFDSGAGIGIIKKNIL